MLKHSVKLLNFFIAVILFIGGSQVFAQVNNEADIYDVTTINAIVKAVYECISGPQGTKRDWERFRSLFLEDALLTAVRPDRDGNLFLSTLTVEEFIERTTPLYESRGFFEIESHSIIEEFNHIGHSFSTYESRWKLEDEEPFGRGINSFQLYKTGGRWWIQSVFWEYETLEDPIPAKYLPGK